MHNPMECATCWRDERPVRGQDILPAQLQSDGNAIPASRAGRFLPECLVCGCKCRPADLVVAMGRYWGHQFCVEEGNAAHS